MPGTGFITIRAVCDDSCVLVLGQKWSSGLKPATIDRDQMQKYPSIKGRERNGEADDGREDDSIIVVNFRFVTFLGLPSFVMPTSLADDISRMASLVLV